MTHDTLALEVPDAWKGKIVYVYLRGGGGPALHSGFSVAAYR